MTTEQHPTPAEPGTVDPNVTRLLLTITWNGNYYQPNERAEVATDWIRSAFVDRDDSPGVSVATRPTRPLDRIRRQVLEALGREDDGSSTVSELVDALADELTQTRRLLELEQRKVEVTPDEAYVLLGGVLNKTRRDLDQARIRAEQCEQAGESLARIIGFLTGEDIGEHDGTNDPWKNAAEAGKEALPLRAALEQAEACVTATRQMANEANAALRTQLLAALAREDDGKTPLSQYVTDLAGELDDMAANLRDAAGVVAGLEADLDRVEAERNRLRDANDGLAFALAEILGRFREVGGPGNQYYVPDWINAATIDRWRKALNDSEQAKVSASGSSERAQEPATADVDHVTTVANALVAAAGNDEIWHSLYGDIVGNPMTLARIAVDAYRQAAR